MASFPAEINLSVENREALKAVTQVEGGINKLIKGVKEFERVFNDALNPTKIQSRFQLDQERKALALFNRQNEALTNQVRLAAQLGRAYDKLQVKSVGTELRRLESARTSQKALPGGRLIDQKSLPAAGQTSSTRFGADITAAVRAEARVREAVLAEAERQLQADKRATEAKEKIARAAQGEVSATTRTPGAPQPFGLLESADRGIPALTGTARYGQKLQKEVDRQISLTGKLNQETKERVAQYNKAQKFEDKLIKSTGRLTKTRNKASRQTNQAGGKGGGAGRGGGIGNLATGIGFPILFGGGLGSVLGGAAGSAGGFGPQILLSALGGIVDQYVAQLAKIGDSLSSATDILSGLEAAGYRVSASTEGVIASYQKAGLQAEAYELAIAEINRVLGPNGAAKVSDYRVATEELADEYEKAKSALDAELLPAMTGTIRVITGLTGAFNELSQSPIFKALAIGVGNLPGLKEASNIVGAAKAIGETSGNVVVPEQQRRLEEQTSIDEAAKKQEAADKLVETENKLSDASRDRKYIVDAQIKAAEAGVDLANDTVFAAREEVIERQYIIDLQKAGTNEAAKQLALSEKQLALLNLQNSRTSALSKGAKSAPKSKALQLEAQLLQEQIKGFDIITKRVKLEQGEEAALKRVIINAEERTNREAEILEKKRQQALASNKVAGDEAAINAVYDQQLTNLLQRNRLDLDNNKQRAQTLQVEKQIAALKGKQATDRISTGLNRELEDIGVQLADPFGGFDLERQQLLIEQNRRYADTLKPITDELEILRLEQSKTMAVDPAIENRIALLNEQKAVYEQMLPAIAAAEQQQLQLNQTMEMLQPITNAIASGLSSAITGLIDGTKSVEEAFADMFAGIGKAFIDMATQMLAQKLMLTVLKAFTGGAGPAPIPGGDPLSGWSGGGYTGNAPRSGGVDGEGGFLAVLHPQETVIDHYGDARSAMTSSASIAAAFAESSEAMTTAGNNYAYNSATSSYSTSSNSSSVNNGSGASGGSTSTILLETNVINQVEYATVDEVNKKMQQSAKQAEASVYRNMRNKPAVRGRTGV